MVFYAYFSAHWIGSLGLVSSLMFVLIFLSHKKKLGRFGVLFLNQLTKTVKGKSGKIAIVFSSSKNGAVFEGAVGSKLYIDDVKIVTQ